MIRNGFNSQSFHFPAVGGCQLDTHVIVPCKGICLKVFRSILDPFDRLSDYDRGSNRNHVTRIHWDLPAETSTNVRGNNADFLFRKTYMSSNQCYYRANCVGCLGRHINRQFSLSRFKRSDASAGLNGGNMDSRKIYIFLHHNIGVLESLLG